MSILARRNALDWCERAVARVAEMQPLAHAAPAPIFFQMLAMVPPLASRVSAAKIA
jgi:hypothetical protein